MRAIRALLVVLMSIAAGGGAFAIDTIQLPDPILQARYQTLTHELRCMQCQNESIADSPVDLAADLRREVRDMLLAGKTDEEIRDFMSARYSDFILFRPRFSARNAWLWLAPVALLLIGVIIAVRVLRQRAMLLEHDDTLIEDDELKRG